MCNNANGTKYNAAVPPAVVRDDRGRVLADCGCLKRTLPPAESTSPPFEIMPDNVGRVKAWLMEEYASSTFNTCEHQPLPMMSGAPPMRIHIKEGAKPTAIHRPAVIPAHWQEEVKADLE